VLQDAELAAQVQRLRFLVLDEADRMVEAGHFAELDKILRLTIRVGCVRLSPLLHPPYHPASTSRHHYELCG
jgi:hypothetical protein